MGNNHGSYPGCDIRDQNRICFFVPSSMVQGMRTHLASLCQRSWSWSERKHCLRGQCALSCPSGESRKSDERWTSEGFRWISQRQEHTTDGSFSADYPIRRGLQFGLPLLEAVNWVADGCCASSSLGSCWHLAPTGNCRSCAWDGQFLSFPHLWPPKISEHSNIENPSNVWTESNGQTPNLVDTHLKLHDFLVAFGVHRPRERFGSGAFAGARYCGTFPLENPFSGDAGPSRYDAAAAPGLRLILAHLLPSSAARLSRKYGLWLVHRIFHDGLR